MAKNPDFPQDVRLYSRGANPDIENELLPQAGDGYYHDAYNMRPDSSRGSQGSIEKCGYAEYHSGATTIDTDLRCMGAVRVGDRAVSCWAHISGASDPYIMVDGVVVAQHADLEFVYAQNFDIDANENCIGGEILICTETEPMILNVGDMVDNVGTQKYFGEFQKGAYSVNLSKPLDIPVFIELVDQDDGGGLLTGSYRYAMRYVTGLDDEGHGGDVTEWTPFTPLIPVVQNLDKSGTIYPWNATIGGPASSAETSYAIKLRYRVTNILDYEVLQIKRQAYNTGAADVVLAEETIVAQIPIIPGEISVREFIDPFDKTDDIVLDPQEAKVALSYIDSAKTGIFYNKRAVLMNIKTPARDDDPIFLDSGAGRIYSCIRALGKAGMKDPYNATYYKPYMNGEKFSFGAIMFDSIGGNGFVSENNSLKNWQVPNRRFPLSPASQDASNGWARACMTGNTVGPTHEVFDLEDAVIKTDKCSFKNILKFSSFEFPYLAENYGKTNNNPTISGKGEVNWHAGVPGTSNCGTSDDDIAAAGGEVTSKGTVHAHYIPYYPVRSGDNREHGHNYVVNPVVYKDKVTGTSASTAYRPRGFAPNYYSTGVVIEGLSNIPSWAKSFSIVRTKEAGRVICQGLGFFNLAAGSYGTAETMASKSLDSLVFYSQDIEDAMVDVNILEDMKINPDNYKVQFVSPLGYFSEVFNYEERELPSYLDYLVDMMTYVRILHDENGLINPASSSIGISDTNGDRHVAYGKYRNGSFNTLFTGLDGGEVEVDLSSFGVAEEGRGNIASIGVKGIYLNKNTNAGGTTEAVRDASYNREWSWHEPMYIVNIIQAGAIVPDKTINEYLSTGHYQKVESIIGEGNGSAGQIFQLVDERWEDCIPSLENDSGAGRSFIHIRREGASEDEPWINVTYFTYANIQTIHNTIVSDGFYDGVLTGYVKTFGVYSHINDNDRFFTVNFDQLGHFPPSDSKILVKYDNSAPIKIFGGNITIADNTFSPIDKSAQGTTSGDTGFELGVGLPINAFEINARHYVIKQNEDVLVGPLAPIGTYIQGTFKKTPLLPGVALLNVCTTARVRQIATLFTGQTKSPMHYAFGDKHFPQVNYIMRPNRGNSDVRIQDGYYKHYSRSEIYTWDYGGFRTTPKAATSTNIDYAKEPPVEYFSKPKVGFVEQTNFCTRIAWSLPKETNKQFSPSLRTFTSSNIRDIADDQGEIKMAWDAMTGGKGENLYAICESGICMLITEKAILSDLQSDEIGLYSQESFISAEYWIDKNTGIDDQFQRASIAVTTGSDSETGKVRYESLFFMNKNSVYRLSNNVVTDILSDKYESKLKPLIDTILPGYQTEITMGYDIHRDELFVGIDRKDVFVFNQDKNEWIGRFRYYFDQYISFTDKTIGLFGQQEVKLNSGDTEFNEPSPPESWVIQASSMDFFDVKAFVNLVVNSNFSPTQVDILEEDRSNPGTYSVIGKVGSGSIRDYGQFELQIPRRLDNGDRIEGRVILYKIHHSVAPMVFEGGAVTYAKQEFRIVSSRLSNKKLY